MEIRGATRAWRDPRWDRRAALSVADPLSDNSQAGGFKIGDTVFAKSDKRRQFKGRVWGVKNGKVDVQFIGKGRLQCDPDDIEHSSEPISAEVGSNGNPYSH